MQIGALGKTGALRRGAGLDIGYSKFTPYSRTDDYNLGLKKYVAIGLSCKCPRSKLSAENAPQLSMNTIRRFAAASQ
jgi:hypothetical protein